MRTKSTYTTVGKYMLSIGFSPKRFAIGFTITQWNLDLDLGFVWIAVDW